MILNKILAFIFSFFVAASTFASQRIFIFDEIARKLNQESPIFVGGSEEETKHILKEHLNGFVFMALVLKYTQRSYFENSFREKLKEFTGNDDYFQFIDSHPSTAVVAQFVGKNSLSDIIKVLESQHSSIVSMDGVPWAKMPQYYQNVMIAIENSNKKNKKK